jgi:integrase
LGSYTSEPIRDRRDISAIKGHLADKPRDYALFVVGIHTGLRGSDLLALRWRDVLTDESRVVDRLRVTESKTSKLRVIALQEYAKRALESLLRAVGPIDPNVYVFRSREGDGRLTTDRLRQLIVDWTRAAGLNGHFGVRTLRKTFGYHLRKAGADPALLMKIFGHSCQAITMRYLGVDQDETEEVSLRLSL